MKRFLIMAYATIAYALALANIGYIVAFLADFGVPKTVNSGAYNGVLWGSVIFDALLVLVFGLHHSITARSWFKRLWTRFIPASIERATYLYMTASMTFVMVSLWQPIPTTVWRIENSTISTVIVTVYLATWTMMLAATFHFSHFEFFGLRQAWVRFKQQPPTAAPFSSRNLYALVRHPISLGWMLTPWLTPHMTVGQLVWAVTVTLYVLIATRFEEADLLDALGDRYRDYQHRVPAFVPHFKLRSCQEVPPGGRPGMK